jgi:hypothetical protein
VKKQAPAFQEYAADLLADRRFAAMSLPALGLFYILKLRAWLDGSIPADPRTVAAILKEKPREVEQLWTQILPWFVPSGDELILPQHEEQRAKHAAWREKSSRGGKTSGQARRLKGGSTVVEPQANTSNFVLPTSDSITADAGASESEPSTTRTDVDAFLDAFCERYTQRRNGAKYRVVMKRDRPIVHALLKTHGPEHLLNLADELLSTDNEWIAKQTDRGIGILSMKASWLDGVVREREQQRARRHCQFDHQPPCETVTECTARYIRELHALPEKSKTDETAA